MFVIVACSFTQTPSCGDTYPDDEHPPAFLVVGLLLLQSFRLEVLHNVLGREGRHTGSVMIWIDKGSYVFLSFADTFYIVKNSLNHKKKELHFHPALIRVHQE